MPQQQQQQQQGAALPLNSHTAGHPAVGADLSSSTNVSSTGAATATGPAASTPYPPSFLEVMEMVSKGVTPPNVRSDINDKPPDPSRPPSEPRIPPRSKPWESAAAAAKTSGLPFAPHASSSSPNVHLPPLTPSVTSTPSASPARAANGVGSPLDASSPFPSTHASTGAKRNEGVLLHSSKEWLGATSPLQEVRGQDQPAPSHLGLFPPGCLEDGSNSSGSKQQGALWGSSKLNAAAEPYAPSWAASTRQQQQQQQPVISSPAPDSTLAEPSAQTEQEVPAHNHLFQGLVQEVRSGLPEGSRTDGPHQNGQQQGRAAGEAVEAGGSSTSGGNSGPSTATPSTQASAEGAPPASRPLSVLQPNPSWKPPPPPMPTVSHLRQKRAQSASSPAKGPLAPAPSSGSQDGERVEGMQGTTGVHAEASRAPSRQAEHETPAPGDGSNGGGGAVEHPVEIPVESPAGQAATEGGPDEVEQ
uniref:Peroxisomal membrane protein PEX14-like KPWE domain-containing protein n=1 Tax=Dunaliella tertiolecta TaxID=3047 RepID=A0A7S3VJR5_DUNTE